MNGYISAAPPRRSRINLWLGISFATLFLALIVASGVLVYTLVTKDTAAATGGHASQGAQSPTQEPPAKPIGGTIRPQAEPMADEPVAVWSTTLVESVAPGQSENGYDIDATYEHPNGSVFIVGVKHEDDGSGQALLDSLEERSQLGRLECGVIKESGRSGCVGTVEGIGLITVHSPNALPLEVSIWADAFVAEMLKTAETAN